MMTFDQKLYVCAFPYSRDFCKGKTFDVITVRGESFGPFGLSSTFQPDIIVQVLNYSIFLIPTTTCALLKRGRTDDKSPFQTIACFGFPIGLSHLHFAKCTARLRNSMPARQSHFLVWFTSLTLKVNQSALNYLILDYVRPIWNDWNLILRAFFDPLIGTIQKNKMMSNVEHQHLVMPTRSNF